MNISLYDQQKLCQSAKQIIEIAKKHNIEDLWVIPPVGWVEKCGQLDLMFSYNENQVPSITDIVETSLEINEVFNFDFNIEWHDINNIITAASRANEKPYYGIFLEAINSAIPLDMVKPNISLAEQLQDCNRLTTNLSEHSNRAGSCLFQFQKMSLDNNGDVYDQSLIDQHERKHETKYSMSY